MPRRRQRGRGRGAASRRPAAPGEGAADVVMDSGRNADNVKQLAFKYMRKCKVESSTDSESDNNIPKGCRIKVSIATSSVNVKSTAFQKIQFMDPYDGDSESTIQSTCSERNKKYARKVAPDSSTLRDDSGAAEYGFIPSCEAEGEDWDLLSCSDLMETVTTSWQSLDLSERLNTSVASVPGCPDLDMDSGMVTEDASVASGHFLIGLDSRVEKSPLLPTNLTSKENSDFSMLDASLKKREWGLRNEGEKTNRKKRRVSENMVG